MSRGPALSGRRDRMASVVFRPNFVERGAGRGIHHFTRDISNEFGHTEAASVDDFHIDAERPELVPHEGDLSPFGVERAD